MAKRLRLLLFPVFFPCLLHAQQDARDCKDHPLFGRMGHYYIESCKNRYDTFRVRVGTDKHLQTIAGYGQTIRYVFDKKNGVKLPGVPDIINFYEQTILPNQGKRVYSSFEEGSYTMIKNGKEYWVTVSDFQARPGEGVSGYSLVILDKKLGR